MVEAQDEVLGAGNGTGEVLAVGQSLMDSKSSLSNMKASNPRGGLEPASASDHTNHDERRRMFSIHILSFADPVDVALMIVGAVGSIAAGTAGPMQTLLLGQLVNAFGWSRGDLNTMKTEVAKVALRYVYVGCGVAVATFCGTAGWMISAERQAARIRGLYLQAILRQDVPFFDREVSSGDVISRISKDAISIQEAINGIAKVLELTSAFMSGIIISFTRSWRLALMLTATIPLYGVVGWQMGVRISQLEVGLEKAYSEAGRVVEQVLGAIRTVASYTGEKKAVDKYDQVLEATEKIGIRASSVQGFGMTVVMSSLVCSYSLALWYGSRLAASREVSPGDVITALLAVFAGGGGLANMSLCITVVAVGRVAALKMFQVIHRKPAIDSTDTSGLTYQMIGAIELRKVDFSYPTRPDIPIFRNFSLSIKAGSTAALVGESGSGKSTAINLIERFYDPQAGAVLIDGIDIRMMQLRWLRQQIALVSQEPVLFGTTIRDNIAYGKDGVASLDEIRAAAELANAALFIGRMPLGYETQVGERGIQLSGGQKQRVAIARAILKNARILLLDEATSALDSESERMVQVALDRVMVDRTTVVVAHRLSTIKNADSIAVVKEGTILETGTHSELTQRPESAYNDLIRLQDINLQKRQAEESEMAAAESFRSGKLSSHSFFEEAEGASFKNGASARHGGSSRRLGHHDSRSRRMSSSRFSFLSDGVSRISSMPRREDALLDDSIDLEEARGLPPQKISEPHHEKEIDEIQTSGLQKASIVHLLELSKPEISVFALGALASAVSGVILPCFGLFLAHVIGDFFRGTPHDIRKHVGFWALMFLVLAIVQTISSPMDAICFGIAGNKLIRRIRTQTFEKIVRQDIAWFDDEKNSSGALSARLYTDAAGVKALVGDALTILVKSVTTVLVGLVFAFTNGWQLAFVMLGLIPVLSMQGNVVLKGGEGFAENSKEKYEKAIQIAYSAVSNIRTVASFCLEERIVKLFSETCKGPVRNGIKLGVKSGIGSGVASITLFGAYSFGFWISSQFVGWGFMTFEDVFKVFLSIVFTGVGVAQGFALAPNLAKAKDSVISVFAILNQESKIDPAKEEGRTLKTLKGHIEFKDVAFSYPTRPQACVLRNLSFTLKGGKTLALVGESGSGKTSVISLLQRFYDANSGSILIDGVEIKAFQLKWLRQHMGLVGQEPFLFDDSIKANILYGKDDFTKDEDVQGAAKVANAHNFILTLPEGYNTQVGERGVQLSGGQKQRVAIARAVVKNPRILLLDEATSALDAESENVVQQALDQIMVGRSTIVVAHRLSAVKHCDQIAVIKNGAIVEKGTYDELLKNKEGAFSALHQVHNDHSMTS